MKTYSFQELDKQAQVSVVAKYGESQAVEEMAAELIESCDSDRTYKNLFSLLGWQFNKEGERVA